MIIALDGPAGSGKSTIAKKLSNILKIEYLDTGAMYRAVCVYILENNIKIDNITNDVLNNIKIDFNNNLVYLNNIDISNKIRTNDVNNIVSDVSKIDFIREKLVNMQRKIGNNTDIVLDGRDIGTVVFPDADYKFYIDASPKIRAKRRFEQNKEFGIDKNVSIDEIEKNIIMRDSIDMNRKISPLKKAKDAIIINTDNKTVDDCILEIRKVLANE